MYLEHETGRKRKLDAVPDLPAETDEQLARRLHEELNSLTRHGSRRIQTTVYAEQRPHASKTVKAAGASKPSKHGAAAAMDAAIKSELSADMGAAAVAEAEGSEAQHDRSEKPRKRSVLNRELAMLVTDMVESHVKPVTGPRSKVKDGSESQADQQDHDRHGLQQDQQHEDHITTAAKHESSSSLSEQERLAVEHLHAAGPEAVVNKLLVVQHTSVRTSDSGGAGGDSSTTATSSGKTSSSHEHDQQQSSQQKQQQGAAGSVAASAVAAKAAAPPSGSRAGYVSSRLIKIPKLPMVLYGRKWYRARVMEQGDTKVLLEYQGFSHEGGPFWLAKDHPRIWRGSYKGKDWRYLGDGAWEPKASKHDAKARQGKSKVPKGGISRGCSDAGAASAATDPMAAAADSDSEQVPHHGKARRAAAEAVAADGIASERDTTETDQEDEDADADGEGDTVAVREPLTVDSPSVVAVTKQQDQQQQQQQQEQQQQLLLSPVGDVRSQSQRQGEAIEDEQFAEQHCEMQQQRDEHQQGQVQQKLEEQQQLPPVSAEQVSPQPLQQEAAEQKAAEQKAAEQQTAEQQLRRRQSETQSEAAKVVDSCAAVTKIIRRGSGVASRSAVKSAAASSEAAAAAAAIAAAMPAAPGDSSSERQAGDAVAASARSDLCAGRVEEAASHLAGAPSRSRATRGGRASKAADGDAAQSHGRRGSRNARGRTAAQTESAAGKQEHKPGQQREQQPAAQPQQQQQGKQTLGLQIDSSKGMKHSSSSEGLPMSPTSPVAGGSPRAHRRKGVPQRARLDSDDLQQPAQKGKGCSGATNSKSTAGCSPDVADVVEYSYDLHQDQQQQQQVKQPEQLQLHSAEQQLHLGWKGGWKGAYKKGIWQHGGEQQQMQIHQVMGQAGQEPSTSCLQQQSKVTVTDTWFPQQQLEQTRSVGGVHSEEQQPVIGGSDPEDLEAACVLVGASMGRSHSGEVFAYPGYRTSSSAALGTGADNYSQHSQQQHHHPHCHRHASAAVAEDVPLSPRGYGARQSNGRRRGHNWSKPLTRPPRAPVGQHQQQHTSALLGRRHSLNGSISLHQQLMYGSTDLCNGLVTREAAAAAAGGAATSPRVSRQGSLVSSPGNGSGAGGTAGHRGSDPFLLGADSDSKQQVLRHLLNAVGEMQANSGRPDLMFPLQYGGVPLGSSEQPSSHAKTLRLNLQSHLAMPAAAAALLAAVPSLDTVQHMAALHCAFNANLPSLFH